MSEVVLLTAQPRVAGTGVLQTVRLAGGGNARGYHYGNQHFRAGIVQMPRFSALIGFDENGWTGGVVPTSGALEWAPARSADLAAMAACFWPNAPVTVESGDEASGVFTTRLSGKVTDAPVRGDRLVITIGDFSAGLQKPLLTARFAGTGGIEGGTEAKERIKRRSWGRVFNVEGRVLDKANNVFEFGDPAFPLQAIDTLRDKGRAAVPAPTLLAWQGSSEATLAALKAAAAPQGSGVVAPSIACAKWWTRPAGPLTADLRGEVGAAYVENVPAIAERILQAAAGPVISNAAAMLAARPQPAGIHVEEGETVAAALDRLLLGVSLVWILTPAGTVTLREFTFAAPVQTLIADTVTRERTLPPVKSRRVGFQKSYRKHSDGEIVAILAAADVSGLGALALQSQINLGDGFLRDATGAVSLTATGQYGILNGGITIANGVLTGIGTAGVAVDLSRVNMATTGQLSFLNSAGLPVNLGTVTVAGIGYSGAISDLDPQAAGRIADMVSDGKLSPLEKRGPFLTDLRNYEGRNRTLIWRAAAVGLSATTNNQIRASEEFDNVAYWTRLGLAAVTANAVSAPIGDSSADALIEDAGNSAHRVSQGFNALNATRYVFSVFAKAATRLELEVVFSTAMIGTASIRFNLLSGAATFSGAQVERAYMEPAPEGWWRCIIVCTSLAAGGGAHTIFLNPVSGGSSSYAGTDGAAAVYLWGAQLEEATPHPSARPYLKTTNAVAAQVGTAIVDAVVTAYFSFLSALFAAAPRWDDFTQTSTLVTADPGLTPKQTFVQRMSAWAAKMEALAAEIMRQGTLWQNLSGPGLPETGADVTANAQIYIAPPAAITISCDHLGTPADGQLPKTSTAPTVTRGGASVRTSDTTTYAATFVNCAGAINNVQGSADKGRVTVNTVASNNAWVDIVVTIGNIVAPYVRLNVAKQLADAPAASPSTGGTGTGPSQNSVAIAAVESASFSVKSGPIIVRAGAGGKIDLSCFTDYERTFSAPDGATAMIAKFQIRPVGGTFTDVGLEATGSPAETVTTTEPGAPANIGDKQRYPGSLSFSRQASALVAGNDYEVQLLARGSDATRIVPTGSITGTAA